MGQPQRSPRSVLMRHKRLRAFAVCVCVCVLHVRWLSNITPRYLYSGTNLKVSHGLYVSCMRGADMMLFSWSRVNIMPFVFFTDMCNHHSSHHLLTSLPARTQVFASSSDVSRVVRNANCRSSA